MCVISFAVRASTRDTVPSPWFRVQTDPAPVVRNRGCGPTSRVAVTWFVLGSTRVSRFFSGVGTHTAPSPYTTPADFGAICIPAPILFVPGAMRESPPLASVTSHTPSGLTAMPPSLSAGGIGRVAVTWFVFISMRESVLSPQLGTHTLPNPAASPEHGLAPTVITAATGLVFGSSPLTVFFGLLVPHTASAVITCQSGVPGTGKTAIGWIADISRRTPGVATPGLGGRGGRLVSCAQSAAAMASSAISACLRDGEKTRGHCCRTLPRKFPTLPRDVRGFFPSPIVFIYSAKVARTRLGSSRHSVPSRVLESH